MAALVPELVNIASDPAVTTTQLLRRTLVAANRLGVPEIVDWLNAELNGYSKDVPSYRVIRGQLMAHHPYNGLIPYRINDDQFMRLVTEHHEVQSIPEIERILQEGREDTLVRYFSPKQEKGMMDRMPFPMRPQIVFGHSQVSGIVEKVRNRILEWALELEGRGVLGEGLTFTQQEKQIVQEQHIHISGVNASQIQIGSNGANQHQANHGVANTAALKSVADALAAALEQSKASGEVADELRAEIATLKAQAASPKPKWEIVKASAKSVKAIVEGAAGSVFGELAKPHVQVLLGMLPS